jgi:hypothetical protein
MSTMLTAFLCSASERVAAGTEAEADTASCRLCRTGEHYARNRIAYTNQRGRHHGSALARSSQWCAGDAVVFAQIDKRIRHRWLRKSTGRPWPRVVVEDDLDRLPVQAPFHSCSCPPTHPLAYCATHLNTRSLAASPAGRKVAR